jgi:hypothetical protein
MSEGGNIERWKASKVRRNVVVMMIVATRLVLFNPCVVTGRSGASHCDRACAAQLERTEAVMMMVMMMMVVYFCLLHMGIQNLRVLTVIAVGARTKKWCLMLTRGL